MKKILLPLIIVISLILLLILFVFYNRYKGYYQDEQVNNYISKNIEILNENLEFEKRYALSLSLYISKNRIIQESLKDGDQQSALVEISAFLDEVKSTTGIKNIDIQVHTKDLRAFARNWDKSDYFGVKLDGFRKGLVQVKQSKEPLVSIELGKRLNIKAISPILDINKSFAGSIEIIMDFQNVKKRMEKFGLEILGLLDQRFINIAVDLKNHRRVGRYYIVENTFPKKLYRVLSNNKEILDQDKFYYTIGQDIVALVPMKSVGIQDVGLIAILMHANEPKDIAYTYRGIDMDSSSYKPTYKKREIIIK